MDDPVPPSVDKGTDDEERDSDARPKQNVAPEPENVIMAADTCKETSGGVEDLRAQGQAKEVIGESKPWRYWRRNRFVVVSCVLRW